MLLFNEIKNVTNQQGWCLKGPPVLDGEWSIRQLPGTLSGIWYDVQSPGSRSLVLNGTGFMTMYWGRGTAYQVKFDSLDKHYTTVYPEAGRFDLMVKGEVQHITEFDSLASDSLKGEIRAFHNLLALQVLLLTNSWVTGDIAELPVTLQQLSLKKTLVHGDLNLLQKLVALKKIDLSGSLVDSYTSGVLPDWANGIELTLRDLHLSAGDIDDLLNDLAATTTRNGKLDIGGLNARRTSSSNLACTELEARGWTIICVIGYATFGSLDIRFGDENARCEEEAA